MFPEISQVYITLFFVKDTYFLQINLLIKLWRKLHATSQLLVFILELDVLVDLSPSEKSSTHLNLFLYQP